MYEFNCALTPGDQYELDSSAFIDSQAQVQPVESFEKLIPQSFGFIKKLESSIYHEPKLFHAICRLLKHVLITKDLSDVKKKFKKNIGVTFVCKTLLPALSMMDNNAAAAQDLWAVLSNFEWNDRYRYYDHQTSDAVRGIPHVALSQETAKCEVRYRQRQCYVCILFYMGIYES